MVLNDIILHLDQSYNFRIFLSKSLYLSGFFGFFLLFIYFTFCYGGCTNVGIYFKNEKFFAKNRVN